MNTSMPLPKLGTRFSSHGSQFEISFIDRGLCRYSALKGGRIFHIPYEQLEQLYQSGIVKFEFNTSDLQINSALTSSRIHKFKYVEAALIQLNSPTSIRPLTELIQKIAAELQDPNPPNPRTVSRWIQSYQLNNQCIQRIEKEKSGNYHFRFSVEIEHLIYRGIHEIYLCPERRTAIDVMAFIVGESMGNGWASHKIPSLRTIERRIKELDPYKLALAKKGASVARKLLTPSGKSIKSPAILALVEIDTHYLDIIIVDEFSGAILGRPFLSCAIDVHTRVIVGIYISLYPPSALTTMCVVRDMISRPSRGLPGGIPGIIVPDNGVEFKNNSFSRLCETLKITITPSQVATPNNKPHIESFFKTLTEDLIQKLPGTTFSDKEAREGYNSIKHSKMTLCDVQKRVEQWINTIYHTHEHSMTGRVPILAWEDATKIVKPNSMSDEEAKILCRKPVECTINKGRVLVQSIYYYSAALATLEQQKYTKVTVLVDEMDLSHVYIIDPTDKYNLIQAESTDPNYTKGLSMYAHKAAKKIKDDMSKADQKRLGKNANLLARWELLKQIQEDSLKKKPNFKRLIINIPTELQMLSTPIQQAPPEFNEPKSDDKDAIHPSSSSFTSMEI